VNFGEAKARIRAPGATLVLPLSCFADEWVSKPDGPVCVGLRLLSEEDRRKARHVAEQQATELHPAGGDGWIECYNDGAKRQVAALGMCDPNDCTRPSELFPVAEDQVLAALTISGTEFIFGAIEQLEIDSSPLEALATRETLVRLARLLPLVDLTRLNGRLGRRISAMLDEVEGLVDAGAADDASDELQVPVVSEQGLVGGTDGAGKVDVKKAAVNLVTELASLTEERSKAGALASQ
jgi:hypothetical protein